MPNYSYFYVRSVADDDGTVKTQKFLKGDPKLLDMNQDAWTTHGRYKLLTRKLRGGFSGTGDVYNPANAVFQNGLNEISEINSEFSAIANYVVKVQGLIGKSAKRL